MHTLFVVSTDSLNFDPLTIKVLIVYQTDKFQHGKKTFTIDG